MNGILANNEFGGPVGTCSACAPDLLARPTTIAWSNQDAVWTGTGVGADYHVVSSTSLSWDCPCALTWDEMVALDVHTLKDGGDIGLSNFVKEGNEMVWHKQGSIITAYPFANQGRCAGRSVPYTIDVYVNLADLSDYGVRNYVEGTPVMYCSI